MNCFEVRNDFVAFWQKTLEDDRRAQLLAHLRRCASCDRSFRSFALTAPVLYSSSEPEWNSIAMRSTPLRAGAFEELERSGAEYQPPFQGLSKVLPAFVMAAAAVIALYFTAPPPMTFEDAIAADNANAEAATYPSTDSLFGQEVIAQSTAVQDSADE